jgi:predicted protein tyrosine phosphatase
MPQPNNSVPFENTYWVVSHQLLAGEHPIDITEDLTVARLKALLNAGVLVFIDLTEARENIPSYAALLQSLAVERKVTVELHRISIPDRHVPTTEILRSILDLIDRSIANRNPVYVHCFAGIGRTGTIVGCYLQRNGLADARNVLAKISELRREMLGGQEASPHTPDQVAVVVNWNEETQ